ncbi:hypothetical protein BHE74_00032977 [Ensete ventricosum]|nr:hypothetical protein BHE74_00032977 [Ensete ventricosum]
MSWLEAVGDTLFRDGEGEDAVMEVEVLMMRGQGHKLREQGGRVRLVAMGQDSSWGTVAVAMVASQRDAETTAIREEEASVQMVGRWQTRGGHCERTRGRGRVDGGRRGPMPTAASVVVEEAEVRRYVYRMGIFDGVIGSGRRGLSFELKGLTRSSTSLPLLRERSQEEEDPLLGT